MRDVRSVAPEIRRDRISRLGVFADFAWQRKQLQCKFKIDGRRVGTLRNTGALGFVAVAKLHVGAEAAGPERNLFAGSGIGAQLARLSAVSITGLAAQLTRELALRIVRAADEGAEAP